MSLEEVHGDGHAKHPLDLTISVRLVDVTRMLIDKPEHGEDVIQETASEYAAAKPDREVFRFPNLRKNGLPEHEENQAQDEPNSGTHEIPADDGVPELVGDYVQDFVGHDLGIGSPTEMGQSVGEVAILVDDEILHVVVRVPHSIRGQTRTPHEPIQEGEQQSRRLSAENLKDVWVPLEELLHAVVVALPVGTDRQQILDDGRRGVHASALQGPAQRGYALRSDLHEQQPL
mmetsp:Transcript_129070/g.413586  ORF Transcript_129070/g.413586 Transcript_129070/m.413586 type:complete len:231 (+) Transcript_129070:1246-1938(+)